MSRGARELSWQVYFGPKEGRDIDAIGDHVPDRFDQLFGFDSI